MRLPLIGLASFAASSQFIVLVCSSPSLCSSYAHPIRRTVYIKPINTSYYFGLYTCNSVHYPLGISRLIRISPIIAFTHETQRQRCNANRDRSLPNIKRLPTSNLFTF